MPNSGETERRLSGDHGVGSYVPPEFHPASFERGSEPLLERLRQTSGLVATASDVLEELGWNLTVPATELFPRHGVPTPVVGQAVTLRYLPCRRQASRWQETYSKLAHHVAIETAKRGDVLVIEVAGLRGVSVFGGLAAQAVKAAGMKGVIIEGGIRDVDQVIGGGLLAWTRYVTPISGKFRAEAVGVNVSVSIGGVQILPGDVILADVTGICSVPIGAFSEVATRVLEVSTEEAATLLEEHAGRESAG